MQWRGYDRFGPGVVAISMRQEVGQKIGQQAPLYQVASILEAADQVVEWLSVVEGCKAEIERWRGMQAPGTDLGGIEGVLRLGQGALLKGFC